MQRLSLNLSQQHGEHFSPVFTPGSETMQSQPEHTQEATPQVVTSQQKVTTPAVLSEPRQNEQPEKVEQTQEDEANVRPQRFSLLKFRHASDSQLSSRYRRTVPAIPDEPLPAPAIITTAPTQHEHDETGKKTVHTLFGRPQSPFRKNSRNRQSVLGTFGLDGNSSNNRNAASTPDLRQNRPSTGVRQSSKMLDGQVCPPAYGDEANTQLAIPVERLSDSSRSDGSSGSHRVYAQTTTTHTVSTTTTFFKLRRKKKKDKGPLFPLPEKMTPSSGRTSFSKQPRGPSHLRTSMSPGRSSTNVRFDANSGINGSSTVSPDNSTLALTNAPFGLAGPSVLRKRSTNSGHSTPSVLIPPRLGARGRSSTLSSLGRSAERLADPDKHPGSARTSTSTAGRRSFGDLLALPHRFRQNSAPPTRNGYANSPGTPSSKSNSLQITREEEPHLVYPPRQESDTPAEYLAKLEEVVPRGLIATILCKTGDEFSKTCLRKYMRGFSYFGESIDMSIRKMLMEVELPKETQQIDRLLAGFSDRYYECNPGIFASTDETAFIAFSILLLHSDTHNKNNKRKMTKFDYFKNTQQGPAQVSADILDCFYDNICYTPFIHFDDEVAINSHRLSVPRPKKGLLPARSHEKLRGPVDPYLLILDNKLDGLKPPLKEVIDTEDTYNSTGTASAHDVSDLQKAFIRAAILQIVSSRSRPDAFMNQATITNPAEAQMGLVSIKVAKVGLLWRKDQKKKKAQSPWREWGAILTDSKLYFFKDLSWCRKLMAQSESYAKSNRNAPLIFKPPVTSFDPDALMSMDDAVALHDSSYKRHKNALTFIKHGGFEEVFLANSESEMNDWIGKLNYAATFRTANIRMRGLPGPSYEGTRLLRNDSEFSSHSVEASSKEAPRSSIPVDTQAAWEIIFYRRQLVNEKVSDFEERLAHTQKELDNLLRNARHLMVLLPIQQRTRDALIHSAGRMSAKLKWTRVEFWRAKTHRDVLVKDLEQEGVTDFPVPKGSTTTTPQKATPIKEQQTLGRTNTDTSRHTLSPVVSVPTNSRRSSQPILERPLSPAERLSTMNSHSSGVDAPSSMQSDSTRPTSPLAQHAPTLGPPQLGTQRVISASSANEDIVLRDAGLLDVDGAVDTDNRPDTSGSDRERVGAMSPSAEHRSDYAERGNSVRRSLHKTLRDSHGSHHSPSFHRHKKGRESGSSFQTQDSGATRPSESDALKRSTGSFILHGKKASVITMSSEWQATSNEERLRLRGEQQATDNASAKAEKDEVAVDDGTVSNVSDRRSSLAPMEDDKRRSALTTNDEEFVDAKTSVENPDGNHRASVFVDARTGDDSDDTEDEVDNDGDGDSDDNEKTADQKVKSNSKAGAIGYRQVTIPHAARDSDEDEDEHSDD